MCLYNTVYTKTQFKKSLIKLSFINIGTRMLRKMCCIIISKSKNWNAITVLFKQTLIYCIPLKYRRLLFVVYIDQQTGAPHAVCWLKSIVFCILFVNFNIFLHLWQKKAEKVVLVSKNDFDQQTVCGAPICWLKYTTIIVIVIK